MQKRSGKELRELFLKFFESKGCKRHKSFSLVPDDPTLLFTIAGMVPFKPYFLGLKTPEVTRATTAQKCVRTNDIENVGRTARHHTFFEMLGNFSFGDYFKKEIIPWAWEFLTEWVGLDPNRLYVTVYLDDDEAFDIWHEVVGLPKERIFRLGEDDNFWAAGPVGPCGPCSEIIYDQGEEYSCGKPSCTVGCDCDRYLEIWNLVFMQYNRDKEGNLTPLPKKNIDTGMGLERLASVVQCVPNDFETDLFRPIMEQACALSHVTYGADKKKDMAVKVIADHTRAAAFMIADGILPQNDGQGYVLRRIIRRSVRFGRLLGIEEPFLTKLLPAVRASVGEIYTELTEQAATIEQILATEEERFSKTLAQGTELLDSELAKLGGNKRVLDGRVAFELYDTFGFPYELTEEICQEKGVEIDKDEFLAALEEQRTRARAASKQTKGVIAKTVYTELADKVKATDFVGYDKDECEAEIVAIIKDGENVATATGECEIVLDKTPFYAEKGGQVGDTGKITASDLEIEVTDTVYPTAGLCLHKANVTSGAAKVGGKVKAIINSERRAEIRRHHTATHLLQEALCRVLGPHVRQAGSLVTPTFLRFDFNHFAPLTEEEARRVEEIVYSQVLKAEPVTTKVMSLDEAKKTRAKALFDEKYGDTVRVVTAGLDYSCELCGGTHTSNTGEVGLVTIIKEEGIGSGVRRITAVCGKAAQAMAQANARAVANAVEMLGVKGDNLCDRIGELLNEKRLLLNSNKDLKIKATLSEVLGKIKPLETAKGIDLIAEKFDDASPEMLLVISDRIRQKFPSSIVFLAGVSRAENSAVLVAATTEEVAKSGAAAGKLLKEAASAMGGKGGGRPTSAQGGTKDASKLAEGFAKAREVFLQMMA